MRDADTVVRSFALSNSSDPLSATGTKGGPTAAPWRTSWPGAKRTPCHPPPQCSRCMSPPAFELQTTSLAAPTAKLRLAAIRHLFDRLVMGQVVPINPAASVRGPAHSMRKGKTPALDPAEARLLLDSIDVTSQIGLRDRALIALMVYSFGRIGAALAMRVEDVFTQKRRL